MNMMMGLLGRGNPPDVNISLQYCTVSAYAFNQNAVARLKFANDKTYLTGQDQYSWQGVATTAWTVFADWCAPGGTASDYDIRVRMSEGTPLEGGPLDTWLNLGTSREWALVDRIGEADGGAVGAIAIIEIRKVSNGNIVATTTCSFVAHRYG